VIYPEFSGLSNDTYSPEIAAFVEKKQLMKTAVKITVKKLGAPAGIRTPNQQIMRPVEGHQPN
jgi:hypothetical protein